MTDLPVLGWKEQATLPDWGVDRLRVKLDTGARTSALHVEDLEYIGEHDLDGETLPVLRFVVLVGSRDDPQRRTIETPAVGFKRVRDTGAREEKRPVVRTRVICGPLERDTELTITDRTGMNFRMILGRLTLQGACLVDPDHGYRHTPKPPKRKRR